MNRICLCSILIFIFAATAYSVEYDTDDPLLMGKKLFEAGEFEKVYRPELDYVDKDGIAYRAYEAHFILSSGEEKIVLDSEKVEE